MAVTVDSGANATDDPLANDLRVSMDEQVKNQDTDNTQFTTMTMNLPSSTAKSFKEEWLVDRYLPRNTALSATAASADTTFALTTNEGAYAKVGDIAKFLETGEAIRITGVTASAWTGVRGIGSVAAATAGTGTTSGGIIIISGSNEQGGTLPTSLVTEKTTGYNYTGIVRNSWEFTETAQWVGWYSGNPIAYQRKKIAVEHKREIEQTLFDGARSYTSGTTHPRSTTGGITEFVTTNVTTNLSGTMDKGEWNDFLRAGLEYGDTTRKALFASPIVAMVLSEFLQDNWVHARPDDKVWGVKVSGVIDAVHGARIPVFVKNDWRRFGEGTGKHIGSRAMLVDMTDVELVKAPATQNGPRWMAMKSNRQARDKDSLAEEILSEFTFKLAVEVKHSILHGVTG